MKMSGNQKSLSRAVKQFEFHKTKEVEYDDFEKNLIERFERGNISVWDLDQAFKIHDEAKFKERRREEIISNSSGVPFDEKVKDEEVTFHRVRKKKPVA